MAHPRRFYIGLDLGQASDPAAIAVVERYSPPPPEWHDLPIRRPLEYHLRHLERLPLGTSYPMVVQKASGMLARLNRMGGCELVVDATGLGEPVVDMLIDAGIPVVAVTIVFGGQETRTKPAKLLPAAKRRLLETWSVPKRILVFGMQVLLQRQQFKFSKFIREREVFVREVLAFKVKVKKETGADTYAAREGEHDDLVLCTALACWRATIPGHAKMKSPYRNLQAR